MFSLISSRNNQTSHDFDLDSCATSPDDMSQNSQSTSTCPHTDTNQSPLHENSGLAARLRRRMRRPSSKDSKFNQLARQEQRNLSEEIKTCKHYVRNLQHSYKIRQHAKGGSIADLFAKEHATDLSEEIQLCEEELKYEESIHSVDSTRRRGVLRDCSGHGHHRVGTHPLVV